MKLKIFQQHTKNISTFMYWVQSRSSRVRSIILCTTTLCLENTAVVEFMWSRLATMLNDVRYYNAIQIDIDE